MMKWNVGSPVLQRKNDPDSQTSKNFIRAKKMLDLPMPRLTRRQAVLPDKVVRAGGLIPKPCDTDRQARFRLNLSGL